LGHSLLESMKCGTPVIGKVPNMKPSWMNEENGVWTYDFNEIIDILANFTQNWLEDNIKDNYIQTCNLQQVVCSTNKDSFDSKH
jgi:glycosyltransferase involved in cell wall biosynthesis